MDLAITANWVLVFARVSAMLAVFPVFSALNVPLRVRIGIGAVLAYVFALMLPAVPVGKMGLGTLIVLIVQEAGCGLVIGFAARMVFYGLEAVGNVVSRELGFMVASELNPFTHIQNEIPAVMLHFLAVMLFFSLDLHHWMLAGMQRSYELLPVGRAALSTAVCRDAMARTGGIFVVGVQVAAPVIAVSFMITVIFAVLGRAVQQMNVFTESFAFRAMAGLATFGLSLQLMSEHITNYLRRLPEDMLRVAQLMGAR